MATRIRNINYGIVKFLIDSAINVEQFLKQ